MEKLGIFIVGIIVALAVNIKITVAVARLFGVEAESTSAGYRVERVALHDTIVLLASS